MKATQLLPDKLVQSIQTTKPRIQITDAKTPGLKLRVSRSGHKSFALMIRDKAGKYATWTIGTYPDISLKKAREIALQIRVDLKVKGEARPTAPTVARVEELTLRQLLDEAQPVFAKTRKSWRRRGVQTSSTVARNTIECVFSPLLDRPVEQLRAEDFGEIANGYTPVRPRKANTRRMGRCRARFPIWRLSWIGPPIVVGSSARSALAAWAALPSRISGASTIRPPTIRRSRESANGS
ncbi:MAG: hypothetical protein CMI67_12815 [Pelagibaca sp.]|nr:hypothetical protein [Pelagibaca sp.]